jgi:hypothetical protein
MWKIHQEVDRENPEIEIGQDITEYSYTYLWWLLIFFFDSARAS